MDNMLFKSLIIQLDVLSYISDPIPLLLLHGIDIEDFFLTHHGPVVPHDVIELVNIGSDIGLLPDGTKPLPETMLTNHQRSFVEFTWISLEMLKISIFTTASHFDDGLGLNPCITNSYKEFG